MLAFGKKRAKQITKDKKQGRGVAFFTLAGMGGGAYLGWKAGDKLALQFWAPTETRKITILKLSTGLGGLIIGSIAGGLLGQAAFGAKG